MPLTGAVHSPQGRPAWAWRALVKLWLALGQEVRAAQVLDQWLAQAPAETWALASRAHLHAQRGQRAQAIGLLRRLLDHSATARAADWFNLGYLLDADGQWPAAEQAFRQATALDPNLDRAWYGLGLVLVRLGRNDEAVAALRRNTELQPMSPYGWYQLATLHAGQQRRDEALRIIRHLRGFEPRVAAQLEQETGLRA